ncbi:MAG: hypothetical protein OEW77_06605 [Gemmatimonadota bacterium]|nr:hypothetical protein [Gemmatimonadota bacterium]
MTDASPPFAPVRAGFPCPALLSAAARAPLGGARESLLGGVMAVRLNMGLRPPFPLPPSARAARAAAARSWLGALTIPAKTRAALHRAFAASTGTDLAVAADALAQVTEVTSAHLDRGARSELVRLIEGLRVESASLAGLRGGPIE